MELCGVVRSCVELCRTVSSCVRHARVEFHKARDVTFFRQTYVAKSDSDFVLLSQKIELPASLVHEVAERVRVCTSVVNLLRELFFRKVASVGHLGC